MAWPFVMIPGRLFDDDELLFPGSASNDAEDGDRISHVEPCEVEAPITRRESQAARNYLARIPVLTVTPQELPLLPLDHREGFLVAHIDGESSIETILDVCPMTAEEALAILDRLVERGVVEIR